ncbi:MAG: fumarylacetoacetate hydrolase family protein, partial [Desulforhopalus sp.]
MKLVSFKYQDEERIGVIHGEDELIDLSQALAPEKNLPSRMIDFIRLGDAGLDLAEQALAAADKSAVLPTDQVMWLPPIPQPGKICGVALNNSASNSRKISAPDHPAFFLKPASCLVGHGQPLIMRSYYGSMHPEPELALVIGKTARDVSAVDAHDYIYGYTIFNDITGNDMRAGDLFHYHALYASKNDPDKIEKRE